MALLLPLALCLAAYGAAWLAGLVAFAPAKLPKPFPTLADPVLQFMWTILLSLTVVTSFFVPLAAGEELGWRGHMLPRMVEAGVPAPLLVSPLIWGLWLVPRILAAAYGPGGGAPAPASLIFLGSATAYGCFLGRLRLWSRSVWLCIIAHAAWNALTQACFNPAVKPQLWPWLGEDGLLVIIALCVAAPIAKRLLPTRSGAGDQAVANALSASPGANDEFAFKLILLGKFLFSFEVDPPLPRAAYQDRGAGRPRIPLA